MKIFYVTIVFLFFSYVSNAQSKQSASVDRLVLEIGALDALDLDQEARRSNTDYCELEVKYGYPTDDPPGWELMKLQLSDLDENNIDIEYNEDGEWDLSVFCNDFEDRILVSSSDYDESYESILMVSDKDKEVLNRLKYILIVAIMDCKARN